MWMLDLWSLLYLSRTHVLLRNHPPIAGPPDSNEPSPKSSPKPKGKMKKGHCSGVRPRTDQCSCTMIVPCKNTEPYDLSFHIFSNFRWTCSPPGWCCIIQTAICWNQMRWVWASLFLKEWFFANMFVNYSMANVLHQSCYLCLSQESLLRLTGMRPSLRRKWRWTLTWPCHWRKKRSNIPQLLRLIACRRRIGHSSSKSACPCGFLCHRSWPSLVLHILYLSWIPACETDCVVILFFGVVHKHPCHSW